MSGAFPFKAARPKGSGPPKQPSMSFELPAAPPQPQPQPASAPEIVFDEQAPGPDDDAEVNDMLNVTLEEQDVAKNGRRKSKRKSNQKFTPTPPRARPPVAGPKVARFTFAEVLSVIGEGEPILKVVSKITPVIEILKPDDRKRVVDILARLYG